MWDQNIFNNALAQKYANQTTEANARANLENTQASVLPGQAAAQIWLQRASANAENERARTLGPLAESSIAATNAGIGETQARTGLLGAQTNELTTPISDFESRDFYRLLKQQNPFGFLGGGPGTSSSFPNSFAAGAAYVPGYCMGTAYAGGASRVPGKGDGTVDKVPAMLAPGEAVLTKQAAEGLGRGTIAALNAAGAAKMGMPSAKPKPQRYAEGTANVPSTPLTDKQLQDKWFAENWGPILKPPAPAPQPAPKPQNFAKGTHHVMPGKSAKTPPIENYPALANALKMMAQQGAPGGAQPGMMQPPMGQPQS